MENSVIKWIGVVAPFRRLFDIWVEDNKKDSEFYVWINSYSSADEWILMGVEKVECVSRNKVFMRVYNYAKSQVV